MLTTHLFLPDLSDAQRTSQLLARHSSLVTRHFVDLAFLWPQPLAPMHNLGISALLATLPLAVVLIMMGGLRKSGALSAALGLATAFLLAIFVWGMPLHLAALSGLYGFAYAVWPILWIVFAALWLYNLSVDIGNFDLLRRWMSEHASGDPCVQAILVAFCFGALLEGTSGFGSPVAVAGFLLLGLGFKPRQAVTLALIANTTPVAFGGLGIPIVALAGVTGLNLMKLSAMVGRQLPFLSLILPAYLVWVIAGGKGLKRAWPAALAGGGSFALAQFACSNYWGPYAADIVAAMFSTACVIGLLRVWKPALAVVAGAARAENPPPPEAGLTTRQSFAAWTPWVLLAAVMVAWSYFHLFRHWPKECTRPLPAQRGIHHALPQALCRGILLPTLGGGNRRPHGDAPNRPVFPHAAANRDPIRNKNSPPTPHARVDRRAHCGPGVSLQLLRDGLYAGCIPGRVGNTLSAGQRIPGLDRLLLERQRYLRQSPLREPSGGRCSSDRRESNPAGRHQFFRSGDWKDHLSAEYRCRSNHRRPGRA